MDNKEPPEDRATPGPDDLIASIKAGNDDAIESLVKEHASWMTAVAWRITRDQALAEDCVQEAFLNALRKISDFEGRSTLKTWLHRIVVNQALVKLRQRGRANEVQIDQWMPEFDENACRIEQRWPRIPTPEELLERQDNRAFILAQIDQLPESYRIVLQLRDIEELSTSEVAELTGLSEINVKVRLHRARSALKKLIEPLLRRER
ncbi:MAG: RNA polymerase sigma factor [Geminicoccales bacterium]